MTNYHPRTLTPWQSDHTPNLLPLHIRASIQPDGECWLWIRSLSPDGYGWASLNSRTYQAHRLVYQLLRGEIPAGLQLDHLCRVRHCVNPDHLEPVTVRENLTRSPIGTAGQEFCLRCGGPFSMIGKTKPQRRCLKCAKDWARVYAREWRRGIRRRAA